MIQVVHIHTFLSQARNSRVARILRNKIKRFQELIQHVGARVRKAFPNNVEQARCNKRGVESEPKQVRNPFAWVSPPEDFPVNFVNEFVEAQVGKAF